MLEIYTNFFDYLYSHNNSIREQLGVDANQFAILLRKQPHTLGPTLGLEFEKYLRQLIRYGLGVPAIEPYLYEFFAGTGIVRHSPQGPRVYLTPRPSVLTLSAVDVAEIQHALASATAVADVIQPRSLSSKDIVEDGDEPFARGAVKKRSKPRPPGAFASGESRRDGNHVPPNDSPPGPDAPPDLQPSREITVTGHSVDGSPARQFREGETYRLRFSVGPPTTANLSLGDTLVKDIPEGGLKTLWVVTSQDVEFIPALSTCKTQKINGTWLAEFELLIPESGTSETAEIALLAGAEPGSMLVTIYAVSAEGRRDVYREISVSLADEPGVNADETHKAPQQTHLRTTHEWTTPPEHIQVSIKNSVADVSTKRARLEDYQFYEPFAATDNLISGAIQNVRDSLEAFRELHETYLDDLDHADIAARFAGDEAWKPHYNNAHGWQPLPDHADAKHKITFGQIQQTDEWRALATDGYALFERCFPQGTKLRALLEKLLPGSRVDFHWSDQSGPGWVSHVPWALMYMEPVDVTGQTPADPEKFLGLRFRIGTRAWSVNKGSLALGGLDTTHLMHILYWGNRPGDDVGVEAQWQAQEYGTWKQSRLLPDPALPNLKRQILLALDEPRPSPVGLLYFYCHCSVGDGAQPCLRFGNTAQREDTIRRVDLSQRTIPDGPIIFANACTTAQADPHMTSELEQSFFQRGVRAFIGTETKVPIRLASKFAWIYFQFFYRRVDPAPMAAGEALTQARMFLWTQYKNMGGLFYSMANQYDLYLASDHEVLALRH